MTKTQDAPSPLPWYIDPSDDSIIRDAEETIVAAVYCDDHKDAVSRILHAVNREPALRRHEGGAEGSSGLRKRHDLTATKEYRNGYEDIRRVIEQVIAALALAEGKQ